MSKVSTSSAATARTVNATITQQLRVESAGDRNNRASETPPPSSADEQDHVLFQTMPALALPHIDQKVLAGLLKKLVIALLQTELEGETATIKFTQERLQTLAKENQQKIAHMMRKIKKRKKSGKVGKVFGWIGAALGILLGTVLAVVSFGTGAVVAGMLIAASVALAVSLIVMEQTGGMDKLAGLLAKGLAPMFEAFGMSHQKAKMAAQITARIVIAIAVIAIQITLAIASGGATAANLANEVMQLVVNITVKVVVFATAIVSMASAGTQVASGVYQYEALRDQADMAESKAFLQKLRMLIENMQDMIHELIDILMGTQKNMTQLIKDENESHGMLADINVQRSAV